MKIFTASVPFDLHLSITVALAVIRGDRPSRPVHPTFTDELWELTRRCWNQDPSLRPNMSEATEVLRGSLAPIPSPNQPLIIIFLLCSDPTPAPHRRTFSAPPHPDPNPGGRGRVPGRRSVSLVSSSKSPRPVTRIPRPTHWLQDWHVRWNASTTE